MNALPSEIRLTLGKLEALAEEAARERRSRLDNEPDPTPLARTLARLQTDISTLGRILIQPLPEPVHQRLAEPWSRVAGTAAWVLRHAGLALPIRGEAPKLDAMLDIIRRTWRNRSYGDFYGHVLVAEGAVDVMVEPELSLWDMAALVPIVTEAGGTFTDLAGQPGPAGGSAVASNGKLHADILDRLGHTL